MSVFRLKVCAIRGSPIYFPSASCSKIRSWWKAIDSLGVTKKTAWGFSSLSWFLWRSCRRWMIYWWKFGKFSGPLSFFSRSCTYFRRCWDLSWVCLSPITWLTGWFIWFSLEAAGNQCAGCWTRISLSSLLWLSSFSYADLPFRGTSILLLILP